MCGSFEVFFLTGTLVAASTLARSTAVSGRKSASLQDSPADLQVRVPRRGISTETLCGKVTGNLAFCNVLVNGPREVSPVMRFASALSLLMQKRKSASPVAFEEFGTE